MTVACDAALAILTAGERLSEAEFDELKRKRDEAINAMIDNICAEHGWDRSKVSFHASHAGECYCACPEGPCQHVWDGPEWTDDDGSGASCSSVTCSRCGTPAIFHDMRCGP